VSDDSYFEAAAMALYVEREFARFMAERPDEARQMVEDCRVHLDTMKSHDGSPTPSSGAATLTAFLAGRGMIDNDAAYYATLVVGAIQRAEVDSASAQEGS